MNRKCVLDRYSKDALTKFEREYKFNLSMVYESNHAHAAAAAAVGTLFTVKEWNGSNGSALFDDAIALGARIDNGYFSKGH